MHTTNEELHQIMKDYPVLTRQAVATMTLCSSKSTVDRWLLPPKRGNQRNPGYRRMPEHRMALLKAEIRRKKLRKGVDRS